jgi:pimeloyl-ACP methyl ester carboxylesterase
MTAFESRFAEINNVRLHYVSVGQGPLMLFVHGFPEFWGEWEEQLEEFATDHQAVALDMRGYNLSSKPEKITDYAVGELVADIRGLAKHLGHQRMILVAHDWGGAVAWSFANRHPEMLEGLVIINSPHPAVFARELLSNADQQAASDYMRTFREPGVEAFLSENEYAPLVDALFKAGKGWEFTEAVRKKYLAAWGQPGALTGGLNYYRASPIYPPKSEEERAQMQGIADLPRDFFAVSVPTLVVWGEADTALLPGLLDGLDRYVEDLTIKRIPDGSHWVVHEQPDRVNHLIREFIRRITKKDSSP